MTVRKSNLSHLTQAINLMEAHAPVLHGRLPAGAGWFNQARFGMFVHYGLYSLMGRGEWAMYFDQIPVWEYNQLADRFTAENFDAEAVVDLAKRAGAHYVVIGARHHEGFCLWDTQTTDFNTMDRAAGRDLIREYVTACRKAGLRVGIYYSVMSWQWPAIYTGPAEDPAGWEGMVQETHDQVRELMTHYGKIDYLWYDGCVVPGLGDPEIRAEYWRSRELNAMVRGLQPDILINDRAALPEDVTTPEQHLTPPAPGRLWECCQTIGTRWGHHEEDTSLKSSADLIGQIIFCARHGGNFLLNVGPYGDGAVPPAQERVMEEIGAWMAVNGASIHGSEVTPYTAAQHLLGAVTSREKKLYFHISQWPLETARIAGVKSRILSARLLGDARPLNLEAWPDGTALIHGLPESGPVEGGITVMELELEEQISPEPPPSLLIERDTGRHAPAEAKVHPIADWEMEHAQSLEFTVSTLGCYDLELSVVANTATSLAATLDGHARSLLDVSCGKYPVTLRLSGVLLTPGAHRLELASSDAIFGLYLWRAQPVWKSIPPHFWRTIGPFPTRFAPPGDPDDVRAALNQVFPPETALDTAGTYLGVQGREVAWASWPPPPAGEEEEESVNLARLCRSSQPGVCYARLVIESPAPRPLDILLSCDWWANLFVNGILITSARDPEEAAFDGAWFNGWKPGAATVHLVKGRNIFLVKCHPGTTDNWFALFLNDPGDLRFSA